MYGVRAHAHSRMTSTFFGRRNVSSLACVQNDSQACDLPFSVLKSPQKPRFPALRKALPEPRLRHTHFIHTYERKMYRVEAVVSFCRQTPREEANHLQARERKIWHELWFLKDRSNIQRDTHIRSWTQKAHNKPVFFCKIGSTLTERHIHIRALINAKSWISSCFLTHNTGHTTGEICAL